EQKMSGIRNYSELRAASARQSFFELKGGIIAGETTAQHHDLTHVCPESPVKTGFYIMEFQSVYGSDSRKTCRQTERRVHHESICDDLFHVYSLTSAWTLEKVRFWRKKRYEKQF